ncbi:MAG: molybdenum cofactor guanylyltransferase MobA [Pseudomonadota bacterium]
MVKRETIIGMVLAGGRSSRMGSNNKALIQFGSEMLLKRGLRKLSAQVDTVFVSSDLSADELRIGSMKAISDALPNHQGPLAGILTGLRYARANHPDTQYLATVPCDAPFFPHDLVEKLVAAVGASNQVAIARSGDRPHPVFALWPTEIADPLDSWLAGQNRRGLMAFLDTVENMEVEFPINDGVDPFFNVNTPEDLERARHLEACAS